MFIKGHCVHLRHVCEGCRIKSLSIIHNIYALQCNVAVVCYITEHVQ